MHTPSASVQPKWKGEKGLFGEIVDHHAVSGILISGSLRNAVSDIRMLSWACTFLIKSASEDVKVVWHHSYPTVSSFRVLEVCWQGEESWEEIWNGWPRNWPEHPPRACVRAQRVIGLLIFLSIYSSLSSLSIRHLIAMHGKKFRNMVHRSITWLYDGRSWIHQVCSHKCSLYKACQAPPGAVLGRKVYHSLSYGKDRHSFDSLQDHSKLFVSIIEFNINTGNCRRLIFMH